MAGRIGASMAAEIGTMRVTEQIDALRTLSTNPFKYLIAPRLLAGTIMLPILVLIADIIGVFGGYLIAVYKLNFNASTYLKNTWDFSRTDGCDLRPDEGCRVWFRRGPHGLLSRL